MQRVASSLSLDEDSDTSARQVNNKQIYLGEHIGIVGATGTGKTFFVTQGLLPYLARMYPHVPRFIIDSTADPNMRELVPDGVFIEGDTPPDVLRTNSKNERTIVWTPRHSKIPATYAAFFNRLIDERKPVILVIDEIASITKEALSEMDTLFKQLRKHGGTVIAETQRIGKVDTDVFSQLTHFILFTINYEPYDVQQARAYLRVKKEDFRMPVSQYGFFYRKTRGDMPAEEYTSFRDFFTGRA